jgi:recombination protein RecR
MAAHGALRAASNSQSLPVKITTIARGIAFGGELEYADEMTLAKSISNRIPVENFMVPGH